MSKKTTLLCILDGFGLNPRAEGNAVHLAKKPNFDRLWSQYPSSTLITFGERVGLPEGQMGNSEVGHLNIGAGRVVEQWLVRIGRGLKEGYLSHSNAYKDLLKNTKESKTIHLIGLVSEGGVHSHLNHLLALIDQLSRDFSGDIAIHCITDGRDCSPQSGKESIQKLISAIERKKNVYIASIIGRFFAMDRDKRWERTKRAFDLIVKAEGEKFTDPIQCLETSYQKKIFDEFIEPSVMSDKPISSTDGVIFWNFREDRMRQIVKALAVSKFEGFERDSVPFNSSRTLCVTEYDKTFNLPFLFEPQELNNHLGEVVSNAGFLQLRTAETEKYPHVTYFLNGGIEKEYQGEERTLIPSPREVRTYDQKPEMSAYPVTEVVLDAIKSEKYDLIVVNFANCDMVGHTGVLSAAIKAVETVDECLGKIIIEIEKRSGAAIILADHGNAEQMINYDDGSPFTAHTKYPVPVIVIGAPEGVKLRNDCALCDVAPTILKLMQLEKPEEMTGQSLF